MSFFLRIFVWLYDMRMNKMRKYCTFIVLMVSLLLLPANAQKRKVQVKKTPVVEEEPSKFDEMLDNTQQIMFIDSIVVKKQDFLQYYKLTTEAGTVAGYNQFFKTDDQPYSTVYVNQLGNKCWYANNGRLYTADLLNHQWSQPAELEGLGTFQRANYPYMLSDGTTFYFSAIGAEGLGGLDIYVSRYDSDSGKFLLAENLGLPFNSEANDYMYVVDELNGIGYFATDRRQPDGMVCIYTFIPNQRRVIYPAEDFDEAVIRSRARIDRIADTWGNGTERQEALERMKGLANEASKQQKKEFTFVVNDNVVYTSVSDFRDANNRRRFNELTTMRKRYETLDGEIEKARRYYATMRSGSEKNGLKKEILDYENEYYKLEENIRQLEKTIRNSEIRALK